MATTQSPAEASDALNLATLAAPAVPIFHSYSVFDHRIQFDAVIQPVHLTVTKHTVLEAPITIVLQAPKTV